MTGADSGIGRAVALAFAREGADVLISFLNESEDAQETVRLVHSAGRRAIAVPGDITQEAHCQALVQQAQSEFGHLDILVNNAAFQMPHEKITEVPSEEWDHTFKHKHLRHVLSVQSGPADHAPRRRDHQHGVH